MVENIIEYGWKSFAYLYPLKNKCIKSEYFIEYWLANHPNVTKVCKFVKGVSKYRVVHYMFEENIYTFLVSNKIKQSNL